MAETTAHIRGLWIMEETSWGLKLHSNN